MTEMLPTNRTRRWGRVGLLAAVLALVLAWALAEKAPQRAQELEAAADPVDPGIALPAARLTGKASRAGRQDPPAAAIPVLGERGPPAPDATRRGTFAVSVVDHRGHPVQGAEVRLIQFSEEVEYVRTTEPDGTVRVASAAWGPYVLQVKPDKGSAAVGVRRIVPGPGPYDVMLDEPLPLEVRVVDERGQSHDEQLRLTWHGLRARSKMSSDPLLGGARLLDPGDVARLWLREGAYGIVVRAAEKDSDLVYTYVQPIDPRVGVVTICVPRRGEPVRFEVIDPKTGSHPVATVKYRICVAGRPFEEPCSHGQAGARALASRPLAPGRYDIWASVHRGDERVGWAFAAGVAAGGPPAKLALERGLELAGVVVDPDGIPATTPVEVTVSLDARESDAAADSMRTLEHVVTEPGGAFRFRGLPGAALRVDVRRQMGPLRGVARDLRAPNDGVVIRLEAPVDLRGRISCAGWAGAYEGEIRSGTQRVKIAPDGSFTLRYLPAGLVHLRWYAGRIEVADLGEVRAPARDLVLAVPALWTD